MNLLDKVIQEWSYRTNKGYPDFNSEEDNNLFEHMFGFRLDEQSYRALTWTQLKKKTGATPRVVTLYKLIDDGEPVELITGEKINLEFSNPEFIELFKNGEIEKIKNIGGKNINQFPFFYEKNNQKKIITFSDLAKTPIFGGKGTGALAAGLGYEQVIVNNLNTQLNEIGNPVDIKVGNVIYKDITDVQDVKGTPTADFAFGSNGTPQIYASHKNGTTPTDFQQYAGFKHFINNYAEVQEFVNAVATSKYYFDGELSRKTLLTRKIVGEDLKAKATYGQNQDSTGDFGVNNCQLFLQGDVWLEKKGSYYEIEATKKLINPELPKGMYEPVFVVSYRSNMSSMGIKNARFGIYPKGRYRNALEV